MPNQGALAKLDHDAALAEIASGTIAATIAKRHGTTAQAVRYALMRANPEAYKTAVAEQAHHWIDESSIEMAELPADPVCIARARARADFRLRVAAAVNPAFAAKQHIDHHITVDLGAKLRQAELAIDGQCTIDAIPSDYVKLEDK